MPVRKTPLVTGSYYHVYNCGVARQPIFSSKRDYDRFLLTLSYYRYHTPARRLAQLLNLSTEKYEHEMTILETHPTIVAIVAYACLPNHFHLLLHQQSADGITSFMTHVSNSYAKYRNTRRKRLGPVFQGRFKIVRVETQQQLIHLSRYLHLSPVTEQVVRDTHFADYPWTSFHEYTSGKHHLTAPKRIVETFDSPEAYRAFVQDRTTYPHTLSLVKHLTFEE